MDFLECNLVKIKYFFSGPALSYLWAGTSLQTRDWGSLIHTAFAICFIVYVYLNTIVGSDKITDKD